MEKAKIYSLEAQSAIITAQTAVINQWNRNYFPQIPDNETQLKSSVKEVIDSMTADFRNTQDLVRKAVTAMTQFHKEIYKSQSIKPIK